jgi:exosortase A
MNQVAHPPWGASAVEVSRPWRDALLALLAIVAWTLFLYRDTAVAMVTIWAQSETFNHNFLVLPIVLWLVWRKRLTIATRVPWPMPRVIAVVAVTGLVWLLGEMAAVNVLTQLALVALLVLCVPAVLGGPVTRLIAFPLGFLFFAVPAGEFLLPQFMEWTADFTVFALRLSGIPVYREGLQFVIPTGNWSVIEACSGVRYLMASLTVGTLFAYLNYQSSLRRILFVMVSIVVPILANWVRAYMIVMLGHLSGNKLAAGVDHLIYGWVFFGVVIALMFAIGARWAEPEPTVPPAGAVGGAQAVHASAARLWFTTASLALVLSLPPVAAWLVNRNDVMESVHLRAPEQLGADWHAGGVGLPEFKPAFHNPSTEVQASYASAGRVVGLYVGYYQQQSYGRKLVSSNNVLVGSKDPYWSPVSNGRRRLHIDGQDATLRTTELRGLALPQQTSGTRLLAWQIYWVNGTLTSSDYAAKAHLAVDNLTGRGDASAVIVVYTPQNHPGEADAVLASFLTTNYETINELLMKKP